MSDCRTECPLCGSPASLYFPLAHTNVCKCLASGCGLQFAHPQLDETALARAYRDLYYPDGESGNAIQLENTSENILRQVFRQLEARWGCLRGLRLLDFGCGRGALLRVSWEFGLSPTGIESDPIARLTAAQVEGADTYSSLHELHCAQPNAQFDLIILWTVIEHLRRPWDELERLRKFLRPKGRLLITTMDIRCLRARIERQRWEQYRNPTHLFYFDKHSLNRSIRRAGFSDFAEWRPKIRFAHHGTLRRLLHHLTFAMGLADGLFFVCTKSDESTAAVCETRAKEPPLVPEKSEEGGVYAR